MFAPCRIVSNAMAPARLRCRFIPPIRITFTMLCYFGVYFSRPRQRCCISIASLFDRAPSMPTSELLPNIQCCFPSWREDETRHALGRLWHGITRSLSVAVGDASDDKFASKETALSGCARLLVEVVRYRRHRAQCGLLPSPAAGGVF